MKNSNNDNNDFISIAPFKQEAQNSASSPKTGGQF